MTAPISVVMPTGGRRPLARALAAARTSASAVGGELVVAIDAAAGPEERARVAVEADEAGASLTVGTTPGASATRNAGWRAASAPLVLLVDDDVLLDPTAVGAHLRAHADGVPNRATIGALRWPSDRRITAFERWVERALQFGYHEIGPDGRTGWWHLYTCDCAVPRAALERVGGLDAERFPFGYEDLDLGLRLHDALGGLDVRLLPDGGAVHDTRMTLGEWRSRIRRIARAERTWDAVHPDHPPTLGPRLRAAAADPTPRAGRWAAAIADLVPPPLARRDGWLATRAAIWWEHDLAARFVDEQRRLAAA